jgi:hypothetical protein
MGKEIPGYHQVVHVESSVSISERLVFFAVIAVLVLFPSYC